MIKQNHTHTRNEGESVNEYIMPMWELSNQMKKKNFKSVNLFFPNTGDMSQEYIHMHRHLNTLCLVSNSIFKHRPSYIHQTNYRTYTSEVSLLNA